MDASKRETCENEELKRQGQFWIAKYLLESDAWTISFKVVLAGRDGNSLSELKADHGACNKVETKEGSENCGLATALMTACFEDEDVTGDGGLELDIWFEADPRHRQQAKDNCEKVVLVECKPTPPTTKDACRAYLNAAIKAGYLMMFMAKEETEAQIMNVMKVTVARRDFRPDANAFIDLYGFSWRFCKCKSNRIRQCLRMT